MIEFKQQGLKFYESREEAEQAKAGMKRAGIETWRYSIIAVKLPGFDRTLFQVVRPYLGDDE